MGGASGVGDDLMNFMDELRPRVEGRRGAVRSGGIRWGCEAVTRLFCDCCTTRLRCHCATITQPSHATLIGWRATVTCHLDRVEGDCYVPLHAVTLIE